MAKRVCILGSTGSIGRSALEVVRRYPGDFDVVGLAAHSNTALLANQIQEFQPPYVAISDLAAASTLELPGSNTTLWQGPEGLERLAVLDVDIVLCANVGAAGLKPVLKAIEAGNRIALANKEPLVMAGSLIMAEARARGVEVLPVDSEHNAIFQCLEGHDTADVRCIHLTASGGPFYNRHRDTLCDVSPGQATQHPTWDMGAKISVDSATLMNKGLEVIEAMWLFDLPLDKVRVVIHPQSIIHGLVEFTDGSILAQMGVTDMKFPILFALTWPHRAESAMERLDLTQMRELTFTAPDFDSFPCLAHALEAAQQGGTAPAILNAANEAAVAAFCEERIGFLQIADVVGKVLEQLPADDSMTLDSVLAADAAARYAAEKCVAALGA